mmetsp:Transcript_23221/g.72753  ORF Transcript_23221/g.72753 Transcript_23221/m.72753 type:complete len:209 (+) Transcript_23221:519-1145(+)
MFVVAQVGEVLVIRLKMSRVPFNIESEVFESEDDSHELESSGVVVLALLGDTARPVGDDSFFLPDVALVIRDCLEVEKVSSEALLAGVRAYIEVLGPVGMMDAFAGDEGVDHGIPCCLAVLGPFEGHVELSQFSQRGDDLGKVLDVSSGPRGEAHEAANLSLSVCARDGAGDGHFRNGFQRARRGLQAIGGRDVPEDFNVELQQQKFL